MSYQVVKSREFAQQAEERARKRLAIEAKLKAGEAIQGVGVFGICNGVDIAKLTERALRAARLEKRALRGAEVIETTEHEFRHKHLPAEFDGFKILHLSDFHCAMDRSLPGRLAEHISKLDYDVVVMTGDFQNNIRECETDILREDLARVREAVRGPAFFTLGNHDYLEVEKIATESGFESLVNGHAQLRRERGEIFLLGVDDPHFYRTHLMSMVGEVSKRGFSILLAHSPEVHHSRQLVEVDMVLCGHTHGGQICLPGGIAIANNSRCPRWSTKGRWQLGKTQGYTSRGLGTSGIKARINCPAEVSVHTLRRSKQE